MPRDRKAAQNAKIAKLKRDRALGRPELRIASVPRVFPSSPTAMAIKADDPATRALIDEYLARGRK